VRRKKKKLNKRQLKNPEILLISYQLIILIKCEVSRLLLLSLVHTKQSIFSNPDQTQITDEAIAVCY